MVALGLILAITSVAAIFVLVGLNLGTLALAIIVAAGTVVVALLARAIFTWSLEKALLVATALMCALLVALAIWSASRINLDMNAVGRTTRADSAPSSDSISNLTRASCVAAFQRGAGNGEEFVAPPPMPGRAS